VFSLHGAAGNEGDRTFFDNHLVSKELMTLGIASVQADYQRGVVVAVIFEPSYCEACRELALAVSNSLAWRCARSAVVWTVGSVFWARRGCAAMSISERKMLRGILTP
jgi:hypothetical protein